MGSIDYSTYIDLIKDNPLIAGAAGVVLLILIYLRPKQFLMVFLLAALLGGIFYMIGYVSDIGTAQKQKVMQKSIGK
jgi:hypothetical protein